MEKIYVFQQGQCQTIQSLQEFDDYEVTKKFQMKEQFNTLISMIMNLGNAVNLNAKYLQEMQIQTTKNTEAIANGALEAYDQHTPININYKEYSLEQKIVLQNKIQNQTFFNIRKTNDDYLHRIEENEKKIKSLMSLKLQVEVLEKYKHESEEKIKQLQETVTRLSTKSQLASEISRVEGMLKLQNDKYGVLDKKVAGLEFDLKRNEKQSSQNQLDQKQLIKTQQSVDNFEDEFAELKNTWLTKLQMIEQTLQEKEITFQAMDQFQVLSKKKFDQINQELQILKDNPPQAPNRPQLTNDEVEEIPEIIHPKVRRESSIPQIGKNLNALEYSINELTDRLNDLEGTQRKKLLSIENKVKEFEDLKKLNKLVSRLQLELNSKVSQETYDIDLAQKIDKDEFFDYINKNLVYKDKIDTFKYELQQFKDKIKENIEQNNNDYSYVTNEFSKKWKEIADKMNTLYKMFNNENSQEQQNIRMMKTLQKSNTNIKNELEELKKTVDEQINNRLNSLATSHKIRCLSCGEQDINYPPMNQYTYGDDQKIYLFENNDIKVVDKENFSQAKTRPTTGKII